MELLVFSSNLFWIVYDFFFNKHKSLIKSAFVIAITTASLICNLYIMLDGMAVRKTENAFTFIFWMLLLNGVPMSDFMHFISKNGLRKKNSYSMIRWCYSWYPCYFWLRTCTVVNAIY